MFRVHVSGLDYELAYRPIEPDDHVTVWRCCAHRSPRPSLTACLDIVSDQLADDDGADYMVVPSAAATRRLLAVLDRRPVALVTAEVPVLLTGTPTLAVDPIGEDLAGNCAWDAMVWLAQAGYQSAEVSIYWPAPRGLEQFTADPLPAQWGGAARVLTFSNPAT